MAKLTGRKNYDELVAVYRRTLEAFSDGFYLPRFEALLKDLETKGPQ